MDLAAENECFEVVEWLRENITEENSDSDSSGSSDYSDYSE